MLVSCESVSEMKPTNQTKAIEKNWPGFYGNLFSNLRHQAHLANDGAEPLSLNVLLLGVRQSGRSSVGNALIGGEEFGVGPPAPGVSETTDLRSRTFRRFFRRKGAETDLTFRVMDTPPPRCPSQFSESVRKRFPDGVHVLVLVVRADLPREDSLLTHCAQLMFGPEWRQHAVLVLTHADRLKEAESSTASYLTQAPDWLRTLADTARGGVVFLDNSRGWPVTRGVPLRDRVLSLSASSHHAALRVTTDIIYHT